MSLPRGTRRIATIVVAFVLVIAIAGYAMRPEVIAVETAVVKRGPLRVTIDEDGRTRVRNRFVIAAPVAGRLERITLREGDVVSRGQTVAWIAPLPLDSSSYHIASARLRSAEALRNEAASRIDQARVALDQARNSDRRRAALLSAGAISPELREQSAADVRSSEKELAAALSRARAANADVDAARAALLPTGTDAPHAVPVRSPVKGRVLRVPEPSERVIAASAPILELGDAAALEVISDVLSSDAVRIQPGDAVEIVEWGGDHALSGRVRSIEPSAFTRVSALGVDEQRVNVLVDLLDPPPALGDGFRVEIRATVWESDDILKVPASALFQRDGAWAVFVVENGRAALRKVSIGQRASAFVEVIDGLNSGERIILFPSDKVDAGSRVR
jgi:HlyD family secretion protein